MLVRKLRLDRGWSQETLAEVSSISVRTIQRLERGGNASLESLCALAAVFEVDIANLSTETSMYKQRQIPEQEREALEYVRDIKGFYSHLAMYLIFAPAMVVASFFYNNVIPGTFGRYWAGASGSPPMGSWFSRSLPCSVPTGRSGKSRNGFGVFRVSALASLRILIQATTNSILRLRNRPVL